MLVHVRTFSIFIIMGTKPENFLNQMTKMTIISNYSISASLVLYKYCKHPEVLFDFYVQYNFLLNSEPLSNVLKYYILQPEVKVKK